MAKKEEGVQETKTVEPILNTIEICLELKVTGLMKTVILKKFNNVKTTKSEWLLLLNKQNIKV